LRPVLQNVHFVGGYAYASNGRCLIKQGLNMSSVIDSEHLDGKAIHADNFAIIRKFDLVRANEDGLDCKASDGQEAFFPYTNLNGAVTPDFESVIGKLQSGSVSQIGVTPMVVKELFDAMYTGGDGVVLNFNGANNAITVTVAAYDEQIGFIMPMMIQEVIPFPKQ